MSRPTNPTRRQVQSALAFYSGQSMPANKERKQSSRPEAAALIEVLRTLRAHPSVAWCERQNSGAYKDGDRFIRFGWRGCSDVLGQLHNGRFLAVEVKAPGGRLSEAQEIFLNRVRTAGGVAFVARNANEVLAALAREVAA